MSNDPLSRKVGSVELGACLDMLRGTTPPLTDAQKKLLEEVRTGISGDDGLMVAAELECVLRKGFTDFSLTSYQQLQLVRSKALEMGIELL